MVVFGGVWWCDCGSACAWWCAGSGDDGGAQAVTKVVSFDDEPTLNEPTHQCDPDMRLIPRSAIVLVPTLLWAFAMTVSFLYTSSITSQLWVM